MKPLVLSENSQALKNLMCGLRETTLEDAINKSVMLTNALFAATRNGAGRVYIMDENDNIIEIELK